MAVRAQKENGRRLPAPRRPTVRRSQMYSLNEFMENFGSDSYRMSRSTSTTSTRAPPMSDHVLERRFDGYRKGMRLTDAEPTVMQSDDSDSDTDGIVNDDLPGEYDQIQQSAPRLPTTGGTSQFYSAQQPQQQPGHAKTTDSALISMLQSQQASLERVRSD